MLTLYRIYACPFTLSFIDKLFFEEPHALGIVMNSKDMLINKLFPALLRTGPLFSSCSIYPYLSQFPSVGTVLTRLHGLWLLRERRAWRCWKVLDHLHSKYYSRLNSGLVWSPISVISWVTNSCTNTVLKKCCWKICSMFKITGKKLNNQVGLTCSLVNGFSLGEKGNVVMLLKL